MRTIAAIVYILTVKPIHFLLKNPITLILFISVIVGLVFYGNYKANTAPDEPTPAHSVESILPDKKLAPVLIQTNSRTYYAASVTDDGRVVMISGYWVYNKDKWERGSGELPLDRDLYGVVEVRQR